MLAALWLMSQTLGFVLPALSNARGQEVLPGQPRGLFADHQMPLPTRLETLVLFVLAAGLYTPQNVYNNILLLTRLSKRKFAFALPAPPQ